MVVKDAQGKSVSVSDAQKEEARELLYQILKTELPEQLQEAKMFCSKLQKFSDPLCKDFPSKLLFKLLEKLIKNEKWHCCVLFRLFISLCKDSDAFLKDYTRLFFEQILKKRLWRGKSTREKETWMVVQNGMVAFLSHFPDQKELFRAIRDQGPSSVRESFKAESVRAYWTSMNKR